MSVEYVDVLMPPRFEPTGLVKPVGEAIDAGHWLGVISLWLVRPGASILYQLRPAGGWEPDKLDGSAGGYYRAGELGLDGLREAREELGWAPAPEAVTFIGRHLSVGVDTAGRERRRVVSVYIAECAVEMEDLQLSKEEVPAIYEIKISDAQRIFSSPGQMASADGINCGGERLTRVVSAGDFTYIFGEYHRRMSLIAGRFSQGERSFL